MHYKTDFPEPTAEAVEALAKDLHAVSCEPECPMGFHGYLPLAREQLRQEARKEAGAITERAAKLRQRAADTLERIFLDVEAPSVEDLVEALVEEGLLP